MKPRFVTLALAGALALGGVAVSGSTAHAEHYRSDRLRHAFLRLDINHDGMLGRWEMRHANPRMRARLWRADRNRDGWITHYEMRLAYGIYFAPPRPVYTQPRPVYTQPRPVYVQPRPVVRPRPLVRPRPVYNPPRVRDHRRTTPAPRARDRNHNRRNDRHDNRGNRGNRGHR